MNPLRTASLSAMVGAGLFVAGFATAASVVNPPPAQATEGLRGATSCEALHARLVKQALPLVGPNGWGSGPLPTYSARESTSDAAASQAPATGSSSTGTNVQEVGVDEADLAKTNQKIVVRLVDGVLVIDDVRGSSPARLARLRLPESAAASELLLVGDRVIVKAEGEHVWASDMGAGRIAPGSWDTRIFTIDIADERHPKIVGDVSYSGAAVSLRQYGDVVRLVTSTQNPDLPFMSPRNGSQAAVDRATAHNKSVVRRSKIDAWLPQVTDNLARTPRRPLVECTDVYLPPRESGLSMVSVIGWNPTTAAAPQVSTVNAAGDLVYSSPDHLYVATPRWRDISQPADEPDQTSMAIDEPSTLIWQPRQVANTDVHSFSLAGTAAAYSGSALVPGNIRDRWSMDALNGHLRVATSWQDDQGRPVDNGFVTLRQDANSLVKVGELRGLGRGEMIQSARFYDALAVLVTFRQMDPLYTVDLTDPTRPTLLGELKIPGFSSYLHPIGDDQLVGVGTDATNEGVSLGAQVSLFTMADLRQPERLSSVGFGKNSWAAATDDPRAFTWLPDSGVGVTAVSDDQGAHLKQIRVRDGAMTVSDLTGPAGYTQRVLPLGGTKVAVVSDQGMKLLTLQP